MTIKMEVLSGGNILSGADRGRRDFARLIVEAGDDPPASCPLLLDFADIQVATASYLRETVLAFKRAMRAKRSTYYPVIANAKPSVLEEFDVLAKTFGEVFVTCSNSQASKLVKTELIGELDPKQRLTYDLVVQLGDTDAGELKRSFDDSVQQTAWNNRLASLAGMGLIIEHTQGRSKRYQPIFSRS